MRLAREQGEAETSAPSARVAGTHRAFPSLAILIGGPPEVPAHQLPMSPTSTTSPPALPLNGPSQGCGWEWGMLLCSEWQLPRPAPFQIQLLERRGQLLLEGRGHAVPSEHVWYLFLLQSWPLATWAYFLSETGSLLRAGTMNGSFMPALKYGP